MKVEEEKNGDLGRKKGFGEDRNRGDKGLILSA